MEVGFEDDTIFEGHNRTTGEEGQVHADLIFGSNSELRAIAEVYGCADSSKVCNDL
jgi:catalase-peroxidase